MVELGGRWWWDGGGVGGRAGAARRGRTRRRWLTAAVSWGRTGHDGRGAPHGAARAAGTCLRHQHVTCHTASRARVTLSHQRRGVLRRLRRRALHPVRQLSARGVAPAGRRPPGAALCAARAGCCTPERASCLCMQHSTASCSRCMPHAACHLPRRYVVPHTGGGVDSVDLRVDLVHVPWRRPGHTGDRWPVISNQRSATPNPGRSRCACFASCAPAPVLSCAAMLACLAGQRQGRDEDAARARVDAARARPEPGRQSLDTTSMGRGACALRAARRNDAQRTTHDGRGGHSARGQPCAAVARSGRLAVLGCAVLGWAVLASAAPACAVRCHAALCRAVPGRAWLCGAGQRAAGRPRRSLSATSCATSDADVGLDPDVGRDPGLDVDVDIDVDVDVDTDIDVTLTLTLTSRPPAPPRRSPCMQRVSPAHAHCTARPPRGRPVQRAPPPLVVRDWHA